MHATPVNSSDSLEKLDHLVKNIDRLPVLPKVGSRLFQLLRDDNRNAQKISEVIAVDPALSAQVLKVANSAYYKRQNKISTLKHAVAMLGMVEIEKMAMALCSGAMTRQPLDAGLGVDLEDFSAHLLMTAMLSNRLVGLFKFSMAAPAEAYAVALLHDIGYLVFALNFPKDLLQAMNLSITEKVPMTEAERRTWGVTYAQLGAWLAHKWQLPKTFAETIEQQDQGIPKRALMPEYLAVLQVADRLSLAFQYRNPFHLSQEPPPLHESVLAFLQKSGVSWEGDLVGFLAEKNYDEFYELRSKVTMLTQASVTFEEKEPEFIVRRPKPLR